MIVKWNGENAQVVHVDPKSLISFDVLNDDSTPVKNVLILYPTQDSVIIFPPQHKDTVLDVSHKLHAWLATLGGRPALTEEFGRFLQGLALPTPGEESGAISGPGIFIWQLENILVGGVKGDINRIADEVVRLGFRRVNIKIAHRHLAFGFHPKTRVDQLPAAVKAFRDRGLSVWGWHYIYGEQPEREAQIGISRARALGVDGFTINAEVEFKAGPFMAKIATRYLAELKKGIGDIPVGLSSYRYPVSYHPQFPWRAFFESGVVTLIQPQVYWMLANNPAEQLRRSLKENRELNSKLPIIPTGSVYSEGNWAGPTVSEIAEFNAAVLQEGIPAIDWYAMHELVQRADWMAEIKRQNAMWA